MYVYTHRLKEKKHTHKNILMVAEKAFDKIEY